MRNKFQLFVSLAWILTISLNWQTQDYSTIGILFLPEETCQFFLIICLMLSKIDYLSSSCALHTLCDNVTPKGKKLIPDEAN